MWARDEDAPGRRLLRAPDPAALTAEPKVFHILWNNKFETFDRTALMLYYKALRKKIVLTVHKCQRGQEGFERQPAQSPDPSGSVSPR